MMTIQCPTCQTSYTEKTLNILPAERTVVRVICHVCGERLSVTFVSKRNWRFQTVLVPEVSVLRWDLKRVPADGV